jgi:hypothetical protein
VVEKQQNMDRPSALLQRFRQVARLLDPFSFFILKARGAGAQVLGSSFHFTKNVCRKFNLEHDPV